MLFQVPPYCDCIMKKTCALGRCPTGCGDEVVVTCTGNALSAATGGVHCRFGPARTSACVYEEESGTLTCCPPKVLDSCALILWLVYHSRAPPPLDLLCAPEDRPLLRRPQGLSLDELLSSQLYTDDDVFLADLKDLPALQRCALPRP